MLKEPENDAVVSVYSDVSIPFWTPLMTSHPAGSLARTDKTTREEEEKEEAELEEAKKAIWSSCSIGGGVVLRSRRVPRLVHPDIHL